MPAERRFVILATPRAGSNWLCTLLDSHPEILCHHELFNPDGIHVSRSQNPADLDLGDLEFQRTKPLALLQRAWTRNLGFPVVGFKLNLGQPEAVFSSVLDDPSIAKLLITRGNRVRAYLSEVIAERTGIWESYPDSPRPQKSGPVTVDPKALQAHARRNFEYCEQLRNQLAASGQTALELCYEALSAPSCQRNMLAFLEVDTAQPLTGGTRRMNPGTLESLISNYGELKKALAGSDLEGDLGEKRNHD